MSKFLDDDQQSHNLQSPKYDMNYRIHHQDWKGIEDDVRQLIQPFSKNLKLVVMFGSIVDQSATPGSDIDLLVVADRKIKRSLKEKLVEFSSEQGIPFDLLFFNRSNFDKYRQISVVKHAMSTGVVIWKRTDRID